MKRLMCGLLFIPLFILISCLQKSSEGVTETGNPDIRTYATSTSKGDFGIWKIQKASFQVTWQFIAPTTGAVYFTDDIKGTCGTSLTYGFKQCTTTAISCRPGQWACPAQSVGNTFW